MIKPKDVLRENLELAQMIEDIETKVAQREHWQLQRVILIVTAIVAVVTLIVK